MKLIPTKVRTYAASGMEEFPLSFEIGNDSLDIVEIIDRWYQGDSNPDFPASDYYKVTSYDNAEYLLKHVMKDDTWFICRNE